MNRLPEGNYTGLQLRDIVNQCADDQYFFNVKTYGAKGDGVTDDSESFQNAWNDAYNRGGGNIFIPNGIYIIGNDLVTNINGINPNCQIYAPNPANAPLLTNVCHVRFIGESNFGFRRGYRITHTWKIENGVVIRSIINGTGVNPAVFGGNHVIGWVASSVSFENICIEVNTNNGTTAPTMSGINALYIATCSTKNVTICTDAATNISPSPVGSGVFGLVLGTYSNNGPNVIEQTEVFGFEYGIVFGEHTTVNNNFVMACNYAYVFPTMYYTVVGFNQLIHGCRNALYFPDSTFLGRINATSSSQKTIVNLTIECENVVDPGAWNNFVSHLVDPGNLAAGTIEYTIYIAGSGNLHNDSFIITSGGNNLNLRRSDTNCPMKLVPNTLLSNPKNGMLEYDGTHLYFTIGTTRTQLL